MKKNEIEFVKNFLMKNKDFQKCYIEHNKIDYLTFEGSIDYLLDYVFYSDFNPYLDKCYLDMCWLKDETSGLIYNIDDMYDYYRDSLKENE